MIAALRDRFWAAFWRRQRRFVTARVVTSITNCTFNVPIGSDAIDHTNGDVMVMSCTFNGIAPAIELDREPDDLVVDAGIIVKYPPKDER